MDRLIRNLGENIRDKYENDAEGELDGGSQRSDNLEVPQGHCSGLIVDTPSSFAASSGTGSDHRLTMIKACVDAFRSE